MEQPFKEVGEVWTDKQLLYYLVVSSPSINEQRLEEGSNKRVAFSENRKVDDSVVVVF